MNFFQNSNIDFLGKRRIAFLVSGFLILIGIVSLILKGGPNYGIDFTGGSLVQVHIEKPLSIANIRGALTDIGLAGAEIQNFGEKQEFLIKYKGNQEAKEIVQTLKDKLGMEIRLDRNEQVGPRIGKELQKKAIMAILVGLLLMLIYITVRFNFEFAIGAVVALFHDVFITLGIFSLLNKEITTAIVAALLTIVGYSINDSIVVSDRIRENSKRITPKTPLNRLIEIFNKSINQTLSRTIITSLTTLIVLLILLILGGPVIYDFAFALTVGIVVGTYSSIFVVASLVIEWESIRRRPK